jgi:membrane-associated phospholipid phosphatase
VTENPVVRTPFANVLVTTAALCLAVTTFTSVARATDPERVEWSQDWPRVRLVEGLNIIALTVASYEIDDTLQSPRHPNWTRPILFDEWARHAFRAQTRPAQATARDVGDYLYKGGVLAPYIVDVYLVALGVHQNFDVAIQMALINLQSLGIAGVVSLGTERWVGRQRPYARDCGPDSVARNASGQPLLNRCGSRYDNQSFYSGHAAAVATMAGLTCAHHQHLPLYGGGVADLAPCVLMTAVATYTGMNRVIADKHWASDVVVGWSVGALSGYVLPSLLHYGFKSGRPVAEAKVAGMRMVPVPEAYAGGAGVGIVGVF